MSGTWTTFFQVSTNLRKFWKKEKKNLRWQELRKWSDVEIIIFETILLALTLEVTKNMIQINSEQTDSSKIRIKSGPQKV